MPCSSPKCHGWGRCGCSARSLSTECLSPVSRRNTGLPLEEHGLRGLLSEAYLIVEEAVGAAISETVLVTVHGGGTDLIRSPVHLHMSTSLQSHQHCSGMAAGS